MRFAPSLVTAIVAFSATLIQAWPITDVPSTCYSLSTKPGFVRTEGKNFMLDGKPWKFGGTNAYWMFVLNADEDIYNTFEQYAAQSIGVVRVWAFREAVGQMPAFGNVTNLWQNGQQTCSQGGILRLKVILDAADKYGIKVIFVLTNNWAPTFPSTAPRPPGYLSNSYGGINTYTQQIKPGGHHDDFYSDMDLVTAYQKWLKCVIPAFADNTALFGWEVANDARCTGAQGTTTSGTCTTKTISTWLRIMSAFIASLDSNHVISSGSSGGLCTQTSCLANRINTPTSPAPATVSGGSTTNNLISKKRKRGLTSADILARKHDAERDARNVAEDADSPRMGVRGRWSAPSPSTAAISLVRRDGIVGPAFDGSSGVDSEDQLNDCNVHYGTFQVFPDQNFYGFSGSFGSINKRAGDSSSPGYTSQTVSQSLSFITAQSDLSNVTNSPVLNTAFGLTNNENSDSYTPFDSTRTGDTTGQGVATVTQQNQAFSDITSGMISKGINGILSYQAGATGETSVKGSVIDSSNPPSDLDSSKKRSVKHRQVNHLGVTPNDGYAISPGTTAAQTFQATNQQQAG